MKKYNKIEIQEELERIDDLLNPEGKDYHLLKGNKPKVKLKEVLINQRFLNLELAVGCLQKENKKLTEKIDERINNKV